MRRIAGEVGWLVRWFGVGGVSLRVAGLVLLSRWEKLRSTAPAALGPTRYRFVSFVEKNGAAAVVLVLLASLETLEVLHGALQVTSSTSAVGRVTNAWNK